MARYYIAGSVSRDNGIMKQSNLNEFNNNIDLRKYTVRSNIDMNLTESTKAVVRVSGAFDDYTGPIPGGSELYYNTLRVSPVNFPAYYLPDKTYANSQHILFGNMDQGQYLNPYAEMVRGYRASNSSTMMAQIELEQDFSQWVDGLKARFLANTIRYSNFNLSRSLPPLLHHDGLQPQNR